MVAEPLESPLQEAALELLMLTLIDEGSMMLAEPMAIQALASVIVTPYIPSDKPDILAVVPPLLQE